MSKLIPEATPIRSHFEPAIRFATFIWSGFQSLYDEHHSGCKALHNSPSALFYWVWPLFLNSLALENNRAFFVVRPSGMAIAYLVLGENNRRAYTAKTFFIEAGS